MTSRTQLRNAWLALKDTDVLHLEQSTLTLVLPVPGLPKEQVRALTVLQDISVQIRRPHLLKCESIKSVQQEPYACEPFPLVQLAWPFGQTMMLTAVQSVITVQEEQQLKFHVLPVLIIRLLPESLLKTASGQKLVIMLVVLEPPL